MLYFINKKWTAIVGLRDDGTIEEFMPANERATAVEVSMEKPAIEIKLPKRKYKKSKAKAVAETTGTEDKPKRAKGLTEKIQALHIEGYPASEIAEKLGCALQYVYAVRRKVEARSKQSEERLDDEMPLNYVDRDGFEEDYLRGESDEKLMEKYNLKRFQLAKLKKGLDDAFKA